MLGPFKTIGKLSQKPWWAHLEPLAALFVSHSGQLKPISSFICERHWAYSVQSVGFVKIMTGPIQAHQQFLFWAALGPFNTGHILSKSMLGLFKSVGKLCPKPWSAYSKPLAASPVSSTGPIQHHQQLLLQHYWAYSRSLADSLLSMMGPIQHHHQFLSKSMLGWLKTVGTLSEKPCWAHSRPSVPSVLSCTDPI